MTPIPDSLQLVKADADASLRHANPYSGQIIHAAIEVESIEPVTQATGTLPAETLSELNSAAKENDAEKKQADDMRMWWNEAIAQNMHLPEGYAKVAVLIIKWADELDELKTKAEVCLTWLASGRRLTLEQAKELEALFRDRFHYHTETVELNVKSKTQLQLNSCVSSFAAEHNGPNNLLIVYYTGHGVYYEEKKFLQLAACANPRAGNGLYQDAHANWNKAEDILKDDVDADVLTILDACYASNITKGAQKSTKKFELLCASGIDQITVAGRNSFTRALIDNLKDLLREYGDKPFNTFHLNQRICMDKRRRDTPSALWLRLPSDSNILLAPLKPRTEHARHETSIARAPRGYLTLRFALRDETLNREQIELFTQRLATAFNNKKMIGLKRVDWGGIKSAKISYFERVGLAMYAVAQWKKFLARKREEKSSQRAVDAMDVDLRHGEALPSASRKRSQDLVLDDLPGAKRRTTEDSTHPPLSPPLSNSSRSHEDM